MAKFKRNMIELVKNPEGVIKGDEPEIEKVWTPSFIPFRVTLKANELDTELRKNQELSMTDRIDMLADFVAEQVFAGKITKDDIFDRMHSPGFEGGESAEETLQAQVTFASMGVQTDETKNALSGKSN